jgi:beta-phosphoglucomutase-like phosphatase (HAD superfamily)
LQESDFSAVVGDEEVIHGKPHPEAYLKTAEKLGIKSELCLVSTSRDG